MAKKSANPADAFRKSQRAKELKKNKEQRQKTRETQTIKKDTRDLENEIRQLKDSSSSKPLDASSKSRLTDLESELAHIIRVKEAYVKEHPEARDRVFKKDRAPREDEEQEEANHLYSKDGKLRDPTRSVYFDPVYNPFGVPPPGMPYRERSPVEEKSDESDESDEEIVMPEGPPPGQEDDSDDEEIPLPPGPPPPRDGQPPLPGPSTMPFRPPFQRPPIQPPFVQQLPYVPQPWDASFPESGPALMRPPSRPPHHPNVPHHRPPAVQDPLSDAPTQTYQGYRMGKHELPARPTAPSNASENTKPDIPSAPSSSQPVDFSAGAISAAPVLRDLRKEATVFVPRGVKRKKPIGGLSVNAAPGGGEIDEEGDEVRKRVEAGEGLLGKLKGVLGSETSRDDGGQIGHGDDDYQQFVKGLGGLEQ